MERVGAAAANFFADVYRTGPIPQHVGFIMDGNRRYARSHGLPVVRGHEAGFDSMSRVLEMCYRCGVKEATVFAFSIENFKRSPEEVESLMRLLEEKFARIVQKDALAEQYGVRIKVLGDVHLLPPAVRDLVNRTETMTAQNTRAVLNVCLPYTSRHEIVTGMRKVVQGYVDGSVESVTEAELEAAMYLGSSPPLDILVRTSGMRRLSDFMLWQCVDSRCSFEFLDCLWPEFTNWRMALVLLRWSWRAWQQEKDEKTD